MDSAPKERRHDFHSANMPHGKAWGLVMFFLFFFIFICPPSSHTQVEEARHEENLLLFFFNPLLGLDNPGYKKEKERKEKSLPRSVLKLFI